MASMRTAINAKCYDCIYDPQSGAGNWRQQVQACSCTSCPLWDYRPVSRSDKRQRQRSKGYVQGVTVDDLRGGNMALSEATE
ncbi:hypothetical protein T35B1_16468 [Salinisphaera shabanensis T35B1]